MAFPSRYEPFGAVVIEARGMGEPLVTAKAAGPKAYQEGFTREVFKKNVLELYNHVLSQK